MPGKYSPHPSRLSCLLLFVALVQRLLRARRTARLKLPRPLLRNQSYTMSFESPEQSEKQDSLTCAKVSRARSTRALLTAIFAVRTRCLPAARTFQAACDPDSWVTPLLLYSGAPWNNINEIKAGPCYMPRQRSRCRPAEATCVPPRDRARQIPRADVRERPAAGATLGVSWHRPYTQHGCGG